MFYVISCYMISEWRSHSWHYFLVQNSSKCKPTKIHQINIKCIKITLYMFNMSVENTFIIFGRDNPTQKQLLPSPQIDWILFFVILSMSVMLDLCHFTLTFLFKISRHTCKVRWKLVLQNLTKAAQFFNNAYQGIKLLYIGLGLLQCIVIGVPTLSFLATEEGNDPKVTSRPVAYTLGYILLNTFIICLQ